MDESYVKFLLKRKSFRTFYEAMNYHVDCKEWTECIGMLNCVYETLEIYKNFKPDIVYDIGCGKRPTLGTIVMLNLKSINKVVCIDPALDLSYSNNITGLQKYNMSLKDVINLYNDNLEKSQDENALILCNHSHALKRDIKELTSLFKEWIYITCPCCVDNKLLDKGLYFKDKKVNSPKNEYYVCSSMNFIKG